MSIWPGAPKPETDARLQRTLDAILFAVHSTQSHNGNLESTLDDLVNWLDSDVEKFRANRSFVDALDEVERIHRSLRNLERIAHVWGAE